MKTGEGKTLASVSAVYLNALSGKGVHVVTVNDYLAERDAGWMGPVYDYLGVSVGAILSRMDNDARKAAYAKDITYGTNNEFGFDYLRTTWLVPGRAGAAGTQLLRGGRDRLHPHRRGAHPLIISGPAEDDTSKFNEVNRLVGQLTEVKKDPETGEYPGKRKARSWTGTTRSTKNPSGSLSPPRAWTRSKPPCRSAAHQGIPVRGRNFEFVHYFTQAVRAHTLFHRDVEYVVAEGQIQIVDEFTGRILHGRRYSDGLHEAIEAKERIRVARRNRTLATITFQNFFRMYGKIGA